MIGGLNVAVRQAYARHHKLYELHCEDRKSVV